MLGNPPCFRTAPRSYHLASMQLGLQRVLSTRHVRPKLFLGHFRPGNLVAHRTSNYLYMYAYIYIYTYTYVYIYLYIYVYICAHGPTCNWGRLRNASWETISAVNGDYSATEPPRVPENRTMPTLTVGEGVKHRNLEFHGCKRNDPGSAEGE